MVKILVMDVDGTLTDGKIYIGNNGEIMKAFDAKDGYGIYRLMPEHSIVPVIITGRMSKIVELRAAELGIKEVHQGVSNKAAKIKEIALTFNCSCDDIAYIGDDENDLPAMDFVGGVGCPADASRDVKAMANFISEYRGGCGAVREFIEWLIDDGK